MIEAVASKESFMGGKELCTVNLFFTPRCMETYMYTYTEENGVHY